MDEFQVNVAIRLLAVETILVHVAKVAFVLGGMTGESIEQLREDAKNKMPASFPGFDPAMSDHVTDELRRAVDDLISQIGISVARARSQLLSGLDPT